MSEAPIDAVITWVDGSDPAHAERLRAYLEQTGGPRPAAADPTRFNDAGELEYCVASILRFAPWIARIHIVSDRQQPKLLRLLAGTPFADRLRLVDHREIFAGHEQHLPTFNSRAIITALWRIPGLAVFIDPLQEADSEKQDIDALFFGELAVPRAQGAEPALKI